MGGQANRGAGTAATRVSGRDQRQARKEQGVMCDQVNSSAERKGVDLTRRRRAATPPVAA